MEGKAVLFKRFADIDVFDIEIDSQDVDEIVRTVQLIAPTFGGINLEDIRAPGVLRDRDAPDRDASTSRSSTTTSTAPRSSRARRCSNALELTDRAIGEVQVVFNGAGAAGIACARLYRDLGVPAREHHPVRQPGRDLQGPQRGDEPLQGGVRAATPRRRTLADALRRRDVFVGLSQAGLVTEDDGPIAWPTSRSSSRWRTPTRRSRPEAVGARAPRRDHGDGPLRLPEPGEQRARLPVHLPRRARRARAQDQRGDEAGRGRTRWPSWRCAARRCPRWCATPIPTTCSTSGRATSSRSRSIPRILMYVPVAVAQAAMESGVARREARSRGLPRASRRRSGTSPLSRRRGTL